MQKPAQWRVRFVMTDTTKVIMENLRAIINFFKRQ